MLACAAAPADVHAGEALDLSGYFRKQPADCDALVEQYPQRVDAYFCYSVVARHVGREAVLAHLQRHPVPAANRGLWMMAEGTLEMDLSFPEAEGHLQDAAAQLHAGGHLTGEVHALLNLYFFQKNLGRPTDAAVTLERSDQLATQVGDPILLAWVGVNRAVEAMDADDLSRSLAIMKRLEPLVERQGGDWLRSNLRNNMAAVYLRLGDFPEAVAIYRRLVEEHRRQGDAFSEAGALYNLVLASSRLDPAVAPTREALRQLIQQALAVSVDSRNRPMEASCLLVMGQDRTLSIPERRRSIERAITLSRDTGRIDAELFATRLLANLETTLELQGEAASFALFDQAIEGARSHGMGDALARGYFMRASNNTYYKHPAEAVDDYGHGVEIVERLRDLQADDSVRARFFSQWAFFYERFAGLLMGLDKRLPAASQEAGSIAAAFEVLERIRARALLELLDGAGATDSLAPPGPLKQRRAGLLQQIVSIQRELQLTRLSEAGRREMLAALDRLEAQDLALRDELARQAPGFAAARRFSPPALAELQAQLTPDQALIEYLMWSDRNGSPGALVVTGAAAQVIPLAVPEGSRDRIAAYLGLIERRDPEEPRAAARLERELLAPILKALPSGIQELLISPDGDLHRVPFGALRATEHAEPLAVRFRVTLIPSATVWLHCSRMPAPGRDGAVLSLALPAGPARSGTAAGGAREAALLERLPNTPREARAMLAAFDGNGLVVEGPEASERFFRSQALELYDVIHFAAHAVVDGAHPDRSSIVLFPGGPEEDGLLQIREIVTLPLMGKAIILSACSGASGRIIQGEGMTGLSHAFFQAGSRTVIGSLWPLRDDEAADLMEGLASGLSRGLSLGAALADAQRRRIAEGWPAAAWAGMVVLGDGSMMPHAGAAAGTAGVPGFWPVLLLAAVAVLAWASARPRRLRSRPNPS